MLTACATPKYNYTATVIEKKTIASAEPKVSVPGQVVLSAKRVKEHEAIYLTSPVKISFAYTLMQGYYKKEGDDASAEYFYPSGGIDAGKIEKAILADPWKSVMLPRNGGQLCVITIFNAKACAATTNYEKRTQDVPLEDSFEKTLSYVGRKGDFVIFNYRESKSGVQTPSETKEFQHNLKSSSIVEFGTLKVEILSATDQQITYRVIQ